ncbi:P-loop containing nucleoside triphosphate hydrolase protein [Syncephalis plumigaleata]|nr:P-loop containing nucleoside triphosphate hydrolase protein [Syncephalis plumigaleata]
MLRFIGAPSRITAVVTSRTLCTSAVVCRRADRLRTPNYSSLKKHQTPSHLTGYQLRKKAREEQKYSKTPVSEKTRGFIPVRFKLQPVTSDIQLGASTKTKNIDTKSTKSTDNHHATDVLAAIKSKRPLKAADTFDDLPLEPELCTGLTALLRDAGTLASEATARPTRETGTGKTLAYLLPLINALRVEEREADAEALSLLRRPKYPRAIILAPSRHLADQLLAVSKQLSHYCKFRAVAATRDTPSIRRTFSQTVDVVIGTPRAVADLARQNIIQLDACRWLVLDEADTLLDDSDFLKNSSYLVEALRNNNNDNNNDTVGTDEISNEALSIDATSATSTAPSTSATTMILVGATMPKSVMDQLPTIMPNIIRLATPELHRARRRLHQNFIDIKSFGGSRDAALASTLNQFREVTMVFCNRRETCNHVHNALKQRGINSILFHGGGNENAAYVTRIVGGQQTKRALRKSDRIRKETDTDTKVEDTNLAARGLDTTRVQHVVLYDFPTTVIDYLHRIGRTGRAKQKGHVTALIGPKDRQFAERIRRCIRDHTILS